MECGLITKEAMENYCKGKYNKKISVNEDLELLFEDLRLGKEPDKEIRTYFLPKLTEEDREETSYLEMFQQPYPEVMESEMRLSKSDSRFVYVLGLRSTFTIENSFLQNNSNCCSLQ